MTGVTSFATAVLVAGAVGLAVLAASRLSERIKIPLPALVLLATAVVVELVPHFHPVGQAAVSEVVTVALIAVLFSGGMHMGLRRFRSAAGPLLLAGLPGTFATTALAGVLLHLALGFAWYPALLMATAVAPTDPTVVFSVLGRRQVAGRSGTILEGESGANDPVGIALMSGLLGAHGLTGGGFAHVAWTFVLQMAVGVAIGIGGGRLLLLLMRRLALPDEGLYPLRTLAAALLVYGLATVAHGSGFLAVFTAGILIGDERAPYKREIERFHSALASLGEIVAFVALGLTINLHVLGQTATWVPGVVLGAVLAVVIRPLVIGACLAPARLRARELIFVQFAGLKGAVPILLGGYLLGTHLAHPDRLYGIVIVVVIFSVVVQGGLVGPVTGWLHLPVHIVEPEPWSVGVRLQSDPGNVHSVVVAPGSEADGAAVGELGGLPDDAWVTLLVRNGDLLAVRGDTDLRAGDRLTVLADPGCERALRSVFGPPSG